MNSALKRTAVALCFLVAVPAAADDYANMQSNDDSKAVIEYFKNFGGFLGYDITKSPTANDKSISDELIAIAATKLAEHYVVNTFLGALPVNAMSAALSQFVPTSGANIPGANMMNALANATFNLQQYDNAGSSQQGKASVSALIDQEQYQKDPVSQAVLNILGTPDFTYCMNSDGTDIDLDCKLLFQYRIMNNVIGELPTPNAFFTYDSNQKLIGQLNSNTLLGPLLYSTDNTSQSTGSPTPSKENPGLVAQNQVQEAANFIRYASGAVAPGSLPKAKVYSQLYSKAMPPAGSKVTPMEQMQAQATLGNYLTDLRVFAAQSSVGIANLYYILSKRMPQNQGSDSPILTSQAMSEFQMATWRLFKADLSPDKQWINQINTASPATVHKEIATLLAEINYQMYLDRQIQERILLTNSIMLIQNTRSRQPKGNFANQPDN